MMDMCIQWRKVFGTFLGKRIVQRCEHRVDSKMVGSYHCPSPSQSRSVANDGGAYTLNVDGSVACLRIQIDAYVLVTLQAEFCFDSCAD